MTEDKHYIQEPIIPYKTDGDDTEAQARREAYLRRLAAYLKDPEFRAIEGFPHGTDESILALSDPPYYTACPNPFLPEILEEWQAERAAIREELGLPDDTQPGKQTYQREPFAADVSEGKNDPIYNAHSYHTKVPHKAIMRYILHYTDPGDIVFDGFCGTGMTGVAAQLCGDKKEVESLGYRVDDDGIIYEGDEPISRLGACKAVLNDLSPAATFIAYNYNTPVDAHAFEREAKRILQEVEAECGWMYETLHVEAASCRFISNKLNFSQPHIPQSPSATKSEYQHHGITDFTERQGDLPNWQLPGAHYFITFSTKDKRILSEPARGIVLDALRYWDGQRLDLIAAVVMPDHVHAVIVPREMENGIYWDLSTLPHSIKSYSANQINQLEDRVGETVWLSETYDRIIRDEVEYQRILTYIDNNPEKAGLVKAGGDYPWSYYCETMVKDGWKPSPRGKINYTVWSDVFRCPQCGEEMVFWDVAVDQEKSTIQKDWECPGCRSLLSKSPSKASGAQRVERAQDTVFDRALGETVTQAHLVPVLINYFVGRQRFDKRPDDIDHEVIRKIEESHITYQYPHDPMMFIGENWGDSWRAGYHTGITHVHHFYTKRNLWVLANLFNSITNNYSMVGAFIGVLQGLSKLQRYRPNSTFPNMILSGTLYIGSIIREWNAIDWFSGKIRGILRSYKKRSSIKRAIALIETTSSESINGKNNSIDYLFIDPPFGANLMYSELSFLWEAWLGVFTNNGPEAIINKEQKKKLDDYQALMTGCFEEFYRLLKPGRWMTVEFHNSQNAVWNAIQEALLQAGFVLADVRTLDKQQATFKQVTTTSAVKQDLILSAYKPSSAFEEKFALQGGTVQGAWDFLRQHLEQLPMPNKVGDRIEIQSERTPYLLYDRMLAFHLVRGLTIPLSAGEFYQGLSSGSFLMREGMAFTTAQAYDYDKLRVSADGVQQLALFVTDEASAIQWLRQTLDPETGGGPQTYAELQPEFLKQLHQERYEALPELQVILKQNFLQDENGRWYVPDPARQADLEALKERALLHEFNEVVRGKGKIKVFRSDAIKAGFSKAWAEHDYDQIVAVAERLPEQALQEDPKLKLYVDNARIRASKQPKQEKLL